MTCFKCKNDPIIRMYPRDYKDQSDYIDVCSGHIVSGLDYYIGQGPVVVDRLMLMALASTPLTEEINRPDPLRVEALREEALHMALRGRELEAAQDTVERAGVFFDFLSGATK